MPTYAERLSDGFGMMMDDDPADNDDRDEPYYWNDEDDDETGATDYARAAKPTYRDHPTLLPHFPVGPLTPSSECPHRGPYAKGTARVCMVCHKSGLDHLPFLRRTPRTDPKPDPRPKDAPPKLTAKERKALLKLYAKSADKKTREFLNGLVS